MITNKYLILFTIVVSLSISSFSQNLEGDWKGSMSQGGQNIEIIFHIKKDNGIYITTMDIPLQGASGIIVHKTDVIENRIILYPFPNSNKGFEGELINDKIEGKFIQEGNDIPLTLSKFENKLPGNPLLVSSDKQLKDMANLDKGNYKYNVSDYFSKPKASSFQISPKGKYLSYKEKDANNKNHIYIKEISTGRITRAVEEKNELINSYGWINEERLFFSMDNGGDENYHLFATDLDGNNTKDLTPFEGVKVSIENLLIEQKDFVIISMNKNNKQIMEPYKLNVVSGELYQLFENKDISNPVSEYIFDKDGNLRGYYVIKGTIKEMYYKNNSTSNFDLLKTMNWDDSFIIIDFNYNSKNKDEAYVMSNLDGDKTEVILYDFKKNKTIKSIFSNKIFDVGGISISNKKRNYEIDVFYYEGEKQEIIPVSKFGKSMMEDINKNFPNKNIFVQGSDDDENIYLIAVNSDKLYGAYYEYKVKDRNFKLLYDLMPQLKENDMAEVRPIKFKSRDGLTIYGYITLPKESINGKKVPLIVNPHGGPQGLRDSWVFNPESQLFASRGYATLQVNFRISGGYGKKFLRSGFKQIGRKLMDDIEDGVKYCIEQGWIDKDRIAIYGASHGGYATLMGLIKTPDLYTCGIDYVGVSNIETFFSSFPEYWKPYKEMIKEIWYDLDNPEEQKIAKEVSPVYQIDKIKKPLFVIQGANDPRVKIAESDQVVSALRQKGFEVPYMVKYNEGHGFRREENSKFLYECMLGFLYQNFNR